MKVRTRFAPSPTGDPHIGNIRTALFEWLFARHNKGTFVLRIEDTDQSRLQEGSLEKIIESLSWLGILPDEGVLTHNLEEKGKRGSYIQSQRLEIYQSYTKQLLEKGLAYPCTCSPERLAQLREEQQKRKLPPGYDGQCKTEEPTHNADEFIGSHAIRLAMPNHGHASFQDLIREEVTFDISLEDDPVILKSDGFPTYHLASVVDDHEMDITHVIRGEEWISSAPKHLQLYNALGWKPPRFAHVPMILGPDKSKLSKRHGAQGVLEYRDQGYLPEALKNFLAFLGWNPGDDKEILTEKELIKEFNIENIQKSPAVFDLEKLNWINHKYIQLLSDEELLLNAKPWLKKADCPFENYSDEQLILIVKLAQERIQNFSQLAEYVSYIWKKELEYDASLLVHKKSTKEDTLVVLNGLKELFESTIDSIEIERLTEQVESWRESKSLDRGTVLWPLRIAVTGLKNSPGVYETIQIIEKNKAVSRIQKAIDLLEAL
ncbi:MAG: glutamate--tRNA ligase [Candidatus Jacksonbacteria bacterium]|nr:glutamate--tRNA ligase [Candidatus Jacksonbacteria bacterium]MBT6954734.1 glutamate--tRNA ligase [Candidatus Jacksonbacteria bacterium]